MLKNKRLQLTIGIIACLLLSVLIEVLGFNSDTIFPHHDSIPTISYTESQNENETIFTLDLDNNYAKKLIIDYHTPTNIDYTLEYSTKTLYGESTQTTTEDIFDASFSSAVFNVGQDISQITLTMDTSDANLLTINNISIDNAFHFNKYRTVFIFLALLLVVFLVYFYRDGFKTEKIHVYFATITILLGSMVIIAQPAVTHFSWDDPVHFKNTINLFGPTQPYLEGEYQSIQYEKSVGQNSINSIEEQQYLNGLNNNPSAQENKNAIEFTYSSLSYAPMSIGYHLSKLVGLPFSACFRIGKLFNLILYALLVAYAIRTLKIGKKLLTIIALLPSAFFAACEYSYDPIVFSGIAVFMAHLINLFVDNHSKFNFKIALIMILSISYACLTKTIYAPLLLLVLFIPYTKFATKKQSILVKLGFLTITLMLFSTFILPALNGSTAGDNRITNSSVSGQLAMIFSHPFDYLKLLGNTAVAQLGTSFLDNNSFANSIEILPNANATNFIYIILFLIFFFFLTDNSGNTLNKKYRILTLCAIIVSDILIWTALYLSYTPVGANHIDGVQNRYFIPLLFPALLCLQTTKIKSNINDKISNAIAIIIPATILFIFIYFSILVPYSF